MWEVGGIPARRCEDLCGWMSLWRTWVGAQMSHLSWSQKAPRPLNTATESVTDQPSAFHALWLKVSDSGCRMLTGLLWEMMTLFSSQRTWSKCCRTMIPLRCTTLGASQRAIHRTQTSHTIWLMVEEVLLSAILWHLHCPSSKTVAFTGMVSCLPFLRLWSWWLLFLYSKGHAAKPVSFSFLFWQ